MRLGFALLLFVVVGCGDGTVEPPPKAPTKALEPAVETKKQEQTAKPAPSSELTQQAKAPEPVAVVTATVAPTVTPTPIVTASPLAGEYRLKCSATWEGTLDPAVGPVRIVHEYETAMEGKIEVGPWKPFRICANKAGESEKCAGYLAIREVVAGVWNHNDKPYAFGAHNRVSFVPNSSLGGRVLDAMAGTQLEVESTPTCSRISTENPGWWP